MTTRLLRRATFVVASAAVGVSAVGALTFGPNSQSMVALVVCGFWWLAVIVVAAGRKAQRTDEGLHEWRCPNCDATTRARMADR